MIYVLLVTMLGFAEDGKLRMSHQAAQFPSLAACQAVAEEVVATSRKQIPAVKVLAGCVPMERPVRS